MEKEITIDGNILIVELGEGERDVLGDEESKEIYVPIIGVTLLGELNSWTVVPDTDQMRRIQEALLWSDDFKDNVFFFPRLAMKQAA